MTWAPDYTTVEDLALYLRLPEDRDVETLAHVITAASRAIDEATGRQFGVTAAPELRWYPGRYDRTRQKWLVQIDDLMTLTGLEVEQDGTAITTMEFGPRNALVKGLPYTEMWLDSVSRGSDVEVTATWGWTTVPDAVITACLMQASRLFARRDAPFGVAGSPETGSEMRLLAKIDPDVEVTLRAYRRWWGAV